MLTLPRIIIRDATPYVAIRRRLPMDAVPGFADSAFPALFRWLGEKAVAPEGAAFFKYNVIDMAGELEMEAGVAVAEPVAGDGDVLAGVLPAGHYATTTYAGPYDDLMEVNAVLVGWAKQKGIVWDCEEKVDGDHFACRLEIYVTNPSVEPDRSKWQTEVLIKTAQDIH